MVNPLIAVLYEAMNARFGVVVQTEDAERLRQKLYPLRSADPYFEPLAFVISPFNPADLWVIKKGQSDAEG